MKVSTLSKPIAAICLGVFIGIFSKDYFSPERNLYPKCIVAENGTLSGAIDGSVIEVGEFPDSVMVRYIFDQTCGADPVIDPAVALAYLRQGGRLSMKEASIILAESKVRGYAALQAVIEGIEN